MRTKSSRRAATLIFCALLLLGGWLQFSHISFRWNSDSLGYASFFHDYWHSIAVKGWTATLTTFVGLHPPAYSGVFSALVALNSPPLYWFVLSGLLSLSAIPLVAATTQQALGSRAWLPALGAAALIAVSPHRNAYGLEINNYPMLVFVTAAQLWSFGRWLPSQWEEKTSRSGAIRLGPSLLLITATTLALWTHALAISLPLSQVAVLTLVPSAKAAVAPYLRRLGVALLLCLPLVPAALGGAQADPINPPLGLVAALQAAFHEAPSRYGAWQASLLLAACFPIALNRIALLVGPAQIIALCWVAQLGIGLGIILWLMALGVAATHQFPYYLVLVPAAAALLGLALDPGGKWGKRGMVGASIAVLLALSIDLYGQANAIVSSKQLWKEAPQSHSMVAHAVDSWTHRTALLLVGVPPDATEPLDRTDPAFALLPLTEPASLRPPPVQGLMPADPKWGSPITFAKKRWLYTFDRFEPESIGAIAAHHLQRNERVLLALYGTQHGPGDRDAAEAWARSHGVRGLRAKDQQLYILVPQSELEDGPPTTQESQGKKERE